MTNASVRAGSIIAACTLMIASGCAMRLYEPSGRSDRPERQSALTVDRALPQAEDEAGGPPEGAPPEPRGEEIATEGASAAAIESTPAGRRPLTFKVSPVQDDDDRSSSRGARAPSPRGENPPSAGSVRAGRYWVVMSRYRQPNQAESLVKRLRASGFPASYAPLLDAGTTWYGVSVGPYATEKEAIAAGQGLRAKGYAAWLAEGTAE